MINKWTDASGFLNFNVAMCRFRGADVARVDFVATQLLLNASPSELDRDSSANPAFGSYSIRSR